MKAHFFLLLLVALFAASSGAAQTTTPQVLSKDNLESYRGSWRYHPGDDEAWAQPDFDDSAWETITDTSFETDNLPTSGWKGIGWFRLRLTVDSTLWHYPLAFMMHFTGAAEVYLNGALIASYGVVGSSAETEQALRIDDPGARLISFAFDARAEHVVAIRHSNFVGKDFHRLDDDIAGFSLYVGEPESLAAYIGNVVRQETSVQFFFSAIPLAFAVLFLMLYAFYREEKAHLYFALYAASAALMTFLDLQNGFASNAEAYRLIRLVMTLNFVALMLLGLRFLYALYYEALLRMFWLFCVVAGGLVVWIWIDPFGSFDAASVYALVAIVESARIVGLAIWRKRQGAWIIGVGLLLFIVAGLYDVLLDLGVLQEVGGMGNAYFVGFVGLIVSMSVYLARHVARVNRDLKAQLVQVKALSEKTLAQERLAQQQEVERLRLEGENERKALELEKAQEIKAAYHQLEEAHNHLKTTQTQLIHSEKMASLGKLTAGIAHEIQNPLNFVNNFAELSVELTEELEEELEAQQDKAVADVTGDLKEILADLKVNSAKINEHGKRADGIVKSMLEHSRVTSGKRVPTNMNKLLEEYLGLCYHGVCAEQPGFEVVLERDLDDNVGLLEIVPQEIGRVFFNLLHNAFHAVLEREKREIAGYKPTVAVATHALPDAVKICIKDNGFGILDAIQDQIFEPFFTTKPTGEGTGLGLSLAYDIITQGHSGTLIVESTEGKGTMFIITLPV